MTGEEFRTKYQLVEAVGETGAGSYRGFDAAGLPVMVHLLGSVQPAERHRILGLFASLPSAPRESVLEVADVDGAPFVVTKVLEPFASLRAWLESQGDERATSPPPGSSPTASLGEFTSLFGSAPDEATPADDGPTIVPEIPGALTGAGTTPSTSPDAADGPAAANGPAASEPGEFTRIFESGTEDGQPGSAPQPPVGPPESRGPRSSPAVGPSKPGEFTQLFGHGEPQKAVPDVPPPAEPPRCKPVVRWKDRVEDERTAEAKPRVQWREVPRPEGSERARSPEPPAGQPETEPASEPLSPGEFTEMFGSASGRPSDPPEPPPVGPKGVPGGASGLGRPGVEPQHPSSKAGDFTELFESAERERPTVDRGPGSPASQEPLGRGSDDYVRALDSRDEVLTDRPATPPLVPPPVAPPKTAPPAPGPGPAGPGDFTRIVSGAPVDLGGGGAKSPSEPPWQEAPTSSKPPPNLWFLLVPLGLIVLLAIVLVLALALT
jgi:hypothetical protein